MGTAAPRDTDPRPSVPAQAAALAVLLAAAFGSALVGVLASPDTAGEYASLTRPDWAPPSSVFGPVWTVLYAAIALAGWLVWRRGALRGTALALFAGQLVLNALWTPLFFAAGLRGTALVDIVLLLALITVTIAAFRRTSAAAALLLVPYWAWVAFATALNAAIWWLNRGA
ncbi:TspO/MBR family protein [Nocardiopsis changdeensis]|uniref:Tryptophan-rich sensory protein n=1 Tax=Nocardiopsis changdeensis TaxID=2831969 RepID=A0ABX8BEQ6_9ACTN|nr:MULTISPECIES: TspO/MBR family protein [Nocardiopsis]QUX20734.1 tryptophan-rich sensory protein [Nocardiopsis changdeensis]QYX36666.1 tryptophan-rich sensory protein [Nocardiopsis sp. MT53]